MKFGKGSGSRLPPDPRDSTGLAGRFGIFFGLYFQTLLILRAVLRPKNPFHNSGFRNPKFRFGNPVCFFRERHPTAIQDLSFSQCCATPFTTKAATAMPWLLLLSFAFWRPPIQQSFFGVLLCYSSFTAKHNPAFQEFSRRVIPPSPAGQRLFVAGRKGFPLRERARKEAGRATPGAPEA